MKNLIANKTKMIRLCREYGLEPKKAKCTKAYRNRSWWLDWADSDYSWRVSLMVAGGAPVIGMTILLKKNVKHGSVKRFPWIWPKSLALLKKFRERGGVGSDTT